MTKFCPPPTQETSAAFRQMLASHGIDDVRGVELLRLTRAVNNAYDTILAESPVAASMTPHRWRVLLRIWQEEELGQSAVSPTQLSRAQQVSKNTISDHLRGLEEAGLIERELDAEDRRQFNIKLTQAGRELVLRSTPVQVRLLNQLLDGLQGEEVDQLMTLLDRLHHTLLHNAQHSVTCPDNHAWHA